MRRKGLKEQVLQYVRDHPSANSLEIAEALDTGSEYVRTTLRRSGVSLLNTRGRPSVASLNNNLRSSAAKRGITVKQLVSRLVDVIATENMVDAILDDASEVDA